jgi:chemotaxis protein MotB
MLVELQGQNVSGSEKRKSRLVIEDTPEEAEEWMTSYADTVTLLLCFFIIFFAEYKRQADEAIMMQLSKNFKKMQNITTDNIESERAKAAMLSKIETEVRSEVAKFKDEEVELGIVRNRKEVLLRLYENDFFHIGSYQLKPNGLNVLKRVSALIEPFQDRVFIKVEGHSDSLPVGPMSPYKTNLNLSSLRASQAANVLISNKIAESKIRVVGFGAANQLVPDRMPAAEGAVSGTVGKYIPENGLKNRRIEIRIQIEDEQTDKELELIL